jgi:hypothetical protein
MFVWILFAAAVLGIASLARGRGGNPAVFAAAAIVAFFVGMYAAKLFGPESVMQLVLPWALLGLVAFNARFILGARRPKPDSMWSCPNCRTVNESHFVVCEACQQPWAAS